MRLRRKLAMGPILLVAMMGLSLGSGGITVQAAVTYTIGVDNASPAGRLFMYTDFFPRGGTDVLQNAIIDFKWSTGSADGFHTTTLIKTGETPAAVYADPTLGPVAPDADDGAGTLQENPAVDNSSGLSPTNCGTGVGTPCTFDGSTRVNSGAFPTAPGHDFFVQITAAAPTTVNFLCLIHQGMVGSLTVVPSGASTPASVDAAAAAQLTADTTEAVAAGAAVTVPAATTNANGTKTFNVVAGVETAHEQVLEFFPSSLNITAGDSVKWTSVVHDIHTATFPDNASSAVDDFHHFVCEGTPDTPAAPPPTPPCTVSSDFESHWTPGPAGGTVLANPTTVATSGIIAVAPAPFPDHYTFSVTSAGTYTYHCTVHDHMAGEVLAAAAPALPATGSRTSALPQTPPGNQAPPIAALAILGLALLVGLGITGRRSSA